MVGVQGARRPTKRRAPEGGIAKKASNASRPITWQARRSRAASRGGAMARELGNETRVSSHAFAGMRHQHETDPASSRMRKNGNQGDAELKWRGRGIRRKQGDGVGEIRKHSIPELRHRNGNPGVGNGVVWVVVVPCWPIADPCGHPLLPWPSASMATHYIMLHHCVMSATLHLRLPIWSRCLK